jgi:adenylate cyclase
LGIAVESIELKAGEYLILPLSENEEVRIPIDEQGMMLIPYTDTWADDKRGSSFHRVVEAKYDKTVFDEISNELMWRIALISEISTSQKDFGPTPFERLYPLSGIHAEALSGILGLDKRAFIGWASLPFKIIIMILLIGFAVLCINAKKDAPFHLGFLASFLVIAGVTLYRWQNAAISPWFAFPASMLFFLWLCAFLGRLFVRYKEQLLLRNALSRYFPHALAERIMREGKTELIPAYKELTILFSDISGFTKWSSDKSPEQVHNFLSDYLESMAGILFAHGGTVDKFMGDGILSFFGDPFDMPDHCEHCIKAAIAMQEKVRILAEKWKPIADIDLKVRIGINTGKVIVGNLGNKTRIEYTVIGAAVNLAQRMESNAPVGGILVTADVWEKVKDKFSFAEKRDVTVKGYGDAIEAYVVGKNKK